VPRGQLPALSAALAEKGAAALAEYAQPLPAFSLEPQRATIDHCFGADSMTEIVSRLEADGSAWAKAALTALRAVSPTALCFTLEALRRGGNLTLADALNAEFALTKTTMAYPAWQPARLEDVDSATVAAMFVKEK
jgi:enoyl-CoA hydratase